MKLKNHILSAVLFACLAVGASNVNADDAKPKPYPLKTCVVSGEVLGGDMGKPVTLTYKGQEMKFCCKDCIKDFKKDPDKYLKKLADEQAKAK